MTIQPLKTGATYDDLCLVSDRYIAEMFDGELYASPRPPLPHARAATKLVATLYDRFDLEGPGGWLLLVKPELHFRNDVLVPDIAGWRRERLPAVPDLAYLTLAPDWVCEVLSPSTEAIDRGPKLRIYAREGVVHAWLIDPLRQSLEALAFESRRCEALEAHHGNEAIRARPFEAIELELRALWI